MILLKELAFEVLITMYENAFTWKSKSLEGLQVTAYNSFLCD